MRDLNEPAAPFVLHLGDCLDVMRAMPPASVDAVVTDPPYHLTNNGGGPAKGLDNAYSRSRAGATSTGFMGQTWDGGDVAFRAELWVEAMRVLKPGGYLLAFSGTRTQHRMVCAIEDAGFEIRDQIGWAYGSGFPKSRNIAEQDMEGADAELWTGWGTALKPAWEPICVARKPLAKDLTVAANLLQFGTGAINIDACRVHSTDSAGYAYTVQRMAPGADQNRTGKTHQEDVAFEGLTKDGRWPANLIHDGSPEVVALFPAEAGQQAALKTRNSDKTRNTFGEFAGTTDANFAPHDARGSAARFFYCAKASRKDRNEGLPSSDAPAVATDATMRQCETADWSTRNGNHHPTVKPTDLMAYLVRLVTPPGGLVLDPFMGSGSTGKAAMREGFRFVGIDMTPEYLEIARARISHEWAVAIAAAEAAAVAAAPPPQRDLFEEVA